MNADVKKGLALLCVAAIFAIIWLVLRPTDPPLLRSGLDQQTFADVFRGLAVVSAVIGLVGIVRGLLQD